MSDTCIKCGAPLEEKGFLCPKHLKLQVEIHELKEQTKNMLKGIPQQENNG